MNRFLITAVIFLFRLCLIAIGIAFSALTFFDDTGYLLESLIAKISNATMISRILIALSGLVLWIVLKGLFFITGATMVVKALRWKTPFWHIVKDITEH